MNLQLEYQRLKHQIRLQRHWWFKPHQPYQPLFVVATCRSGSNLLRSYLNNQPGICVQGELLYPGSPFGVRRSHTPPSTAVRHIRLSLQAAKAPVRGCKLMLYQLANCQLTIENVHAAFPHARFVVLYRQDLARQFVSQKLADITRQFALRAGEEKKQARIIVHRDELWAYCGELRNRYRELLSRAWLQECSVLVSYEELVQTPDHWLRHEICPLVGIEAVAASTNLCKQNSQPLSATIANYAEIEQFLPACRQRLEWTHVGSAGRAA
jgi:LPS sulfotransferase NodH